MTDVQCAERIKLLGESMWVEWGNLARRYNACNLGSGTPDFPLYPLLMEELSKAANTPSCNWYTRPQGHGRLVHAIANTYSPLIGRNIDPLTEVQVTIGAYQAVYFVFMSVLNPGDEVIAIDPYFDEYITNCKITETTLVPVSLKLNTDEGRFVLDERGFEEAFTSKTKLVVLNTPHNPTGKVFSRKELEFIAEVCKKNNCLVLSDEVYEHAVFNDHKHISIASMPGMWERTFTVCSAGKSFAVTGWRLGWAYGPAKLIEYMSRVCTCDTFGCPTLLQEAVAGVLEDELNTTPDLSFYTNMNNLLYSNYLKLHQVFTDLKMPVIAAEGGYFMIVNCSQRSFSFQSDPEYLVSEEPEDVKIAKWLTKKYKVSILPLSLFYHADSKHKNTKHLRVCFAKSGQTIDTAVKLLMSVE